MKPYLLCFVVAMSMALIGCKDKGPAEEAGARVDEVIDNIKHGDAALKEKGTMERMGESIDESLDGEENE